MPRVLQQIQEQRTRGVLVIPFWPSGLFGLFYAWARRDLPSKLQIRWIGPFPKIFTRPLRVVGVFWNRRPFVFYGGIESELSRFINASCVRITFQLGQCCQDHIFVYVDNYKRCYLITFLLLVWVGRKRLQCVKLSVRIGCVFCFLLTKKKKKKMAERGECLAAWQRGSHMANSSKK